MTMATNRALAPASELARKNAVRFPNESDTIRHFWSGEMGFATADPGQDPRGAPDLMPLWTILDATPEGRGTDWYPKLEYGDNGGARRR
jgi:predicted dithiol-disulfide oxidoreductase (DUF899 family)